MKILMRGDLNRNIGQGHIMRMLSIADAFSEDQESICAFVVANDTIPDLIISRGYEVFTLSGSFREMDSEIVELKSIVKDFDADFLFIDSYYVTVKYLNAARKLCKTVYLDDVYAFAYPVDYLINYNVYANIEDYKALYTNESTYEDKTERIQMPEMILGATYAPLRREFQNIPKKKQEKQVLGIAVSFGGADPMHMAKSFLDEWLKNDRDRIKLHMILGAMEPDLEEIRKTAEKNDDIILHINAKDMKEILLHADLAVSAAGSTQYEICACQVPCVNFSMADNQVPGGEEFGRRGIFRYVGDVRNNPFFYQNLIQAIDELAGDYNERCRMAEAEFLLVDGKGAGRIADYFKGAV